MSSDIGDFFNIIKNVKSNMSLDEIREKYGDAILKSRDEINKIKAEFHKTWNRKRKYKCQYSTPKGCCGKTIRAHSIQRSLLSQLADSTNHVLMFRADFTTHQKPKLCLERVGINKATIFYGLCPKHDTEIFEPIENEPINPLNNKHNFFLAYRALYRECFIKNKSYSIFREIVDSEAVKQNRDEYLRAIILFMAYNHYLGAFFINKIKRIFDIALMKQDYDTIFDYNYRVIHRLIPISVCSTITPVYDIDNRVINNFADYKECPKYLFLNVIPAKSKTYLTICTVKKQTDELKGIIDPFINLKVRNFYDYLSEIILKYIENFVISPDYWKRFCEKKKMAIIQFFNDTIFDKEVSYIPDLHNICKL